MLRNRAGYRNFEPRATAGFRSDADKGRLRWRLRLLALGRLVVARVFLRESGCLSYLDQRLQNPAGLGDGFPQYLG